MVYGNTRQRLSTQRRGDNLKTAYVQIIYKVILFPQSTVVTMRTNYFSIKTTLHFAHTVYLCVPYGSHNKQRLFPQTPLTGWAL
jgi:hypothetical protein